jgi:prevent-host-death family protein
METTSTLLEIETLGEAARSAVDGVERGGSVIVTREGRPVAALVAVESLQALQRERELLRRLALGELESAAGEGEELEAVLSDCRLLLEES